MVTWSPSADDVRRVFAEQNPWHTTGVVPDVLAREVERPLAQHLWRTLLDDTPHRFQLILGPRRVGKSTVLYQTVRHLLDEGIEPTRLWWLRLDHPLLFQHDLEQLLAAVITNSGATNERPVYVFLDELVYADQWDLWLKTFYDDRWPVRIAATSSATAALRDRRLESGIGRWAEQHLMPYLLPEFLELVDERPTVEVGTHLADTLSKLSPTARPGRHLEQLRRRLMFVGGFPELLAFTGAVHDDDETGLLLSSQRVLRSDAVERAIYKDIPQSFGVDNPMQLERLLYVLAGQVTGLLAPTNISSDIGMSQPTFDRYLAYLEQAFLVFTLPNYSGSEAKIQKRGRKIYFVDGAVRNAALQRGIAPLSDPVEMGALIENLAAASLRSLAIHSGIRLHHWRDKKDEVDLIFDDPAQPLAFEIASSPEHKRTGLRALVERYPAFGGNTYLVAPQATFMAPENTSSGVGTIPLDLFLLAVGAQADVALIRNVTGVGAERSAGPSTARLSDPWSACTVRFLPSHRGAPHVALGFERFRS